jgi:hypothetical protein
MEKIGEKSEGKKAETRRGRPKKDTDPQKTAPLFSEQSSISQEESIGYDDILSGDDYDGEIGEGTVMEGGGGFSIADRMAVCARLARSSKSEQVRLNATIKYSELERELRLEQGDTDLGEEMLAFLQLVRDQTAGEMSRDL